MVPLELSISQTASFRRAQVLDPSVTSSPRCLEDLAAEFDRQEPLSTAFYKKFPTTPQATLQYWSDFWELWLDDAVSNGLSGTLTHPSGQLAGILVYRDLHYMPVGFEAKFLNHLNFMSAILRLEAQMIEKLEPNHKEALGKVGKVYEIWGGAVVPEYLGKRILEKLIDFTDQLAVKKGFEYAYGYSVNAKSARSIKRRGYDQIAEGDAVSFETEGVRPFEFVEELHRHPSLWLKTLSK